MASARRPQTQAQAQVQRDPQALAGWPAGPVLLGGHCPGVCVGSVRRWDQARGSRRPRLGLRPCLSGVSRWLSCHVLVPSAQHMPLLCPSLNTRDFPLRILCGRGVSLRCPSEPSASSGPCFPAGPAPHLLRSPLPTAHLPCPPPWPRVCTARSRETQPGPRGPHGSWSRQADSSAPRPRSHMGPRPRGGSLSSSPVASSSPLSTVCGCKIRWKETLLRRPSL